MVSFLDILRNDYLGHFDTFGESLDFGTFKNDAFENDTFESVWVDAQGQFHECIKHEFKFNQVKWISKG